MKNLKRRCAIGLYCCGISLMMMILMIFTNILIPCYKNHVTFKDLHHTCSHFPLFPHWGIIVLALMCVILLFWLVRIMYISYNKIFKPLQECEEFVTQLADNNIPEPLDIDRNKRTKITSFINALNLLRDRILSQANRLQMRQNREMKLRKSIDQASELKSIIVSRLAPDIRLPLQTLAGINDMLKVKIGLNEVKNEELVEYCNNIQHAIVTISNLILRIIKFAESTNADSEIAQINTVTTADLINEAISTNKFLLNERNVELNTIFSPTMPETITIADELLNQILIILTRAIFRASEHGENIVIYCNSTEDEVLIHVRDCKFAKSRENLSEAFNNFDVENATYKDYNKLSTTILGLFFVKFELEAIGGSLEVVSNEQANNETIIRFNKIDVLSTDIDDNTSKKEITKDILFSPSNYIQTSENNQELYLHERDGERYRILLCEDNRNNAYVTTKFMELYNFDVVPMVNSQEILEQMKSDNFDAIILTNSMRHRHLLKVIEQIRTEYAEKNIPIVVLVSKINKTKELELRNLGVSRIMLKPIKFVHLAHRLRQLINYSHQD